MTLRISTHNFFSRLCLAWRYTHLCAHAHKRKYIDVSDYYWKWCYVSHQSWSVSSPFDFVDFDFCAHQLRTSTVVPYVIWHHLLSFSDWVKWKACTLTNLHALNIFCNIIYIFCVQCQGHIGIDEMPWLSSANFVLFSTSGLGMLKSASMFSIEYPVRHQAT